LAHQHVLEFVLLEDFVVNVENGPTGIAEHKFDPFLGQTTYDDLSAVASIKWQKINSLVSL